MDALHVMHKAFLVLTHTYPKLRSQAVRYRSRTAARSELRFPPIAVGKIEPWVFHLLMSVQKLLEKGKNEDALSLCHEELSLAFHREGQYDCYHRVISLFTRHQDFDAAISLCHRMIGEGYTLPVKTFTVLLRAIRSGKPSHIQQVRDMLSDGGVKADDLAFKAILDSMELQNATPEELEAALDAYSAIRGPGWTATPDIYGTIIRAYAMAGNLNRAQEWLDMYRSTHQDAPPSDLPRNSRPQRQKLFPYAAVLSGYVSLPNPPTARIEWLFQRMREDGIHPDTTMCNLLIPAFFRWGWTHRAYAIYRSMIAPESASLPDAYTFRHIFIVLNPRKTRRENNFPNGMTARQLFKDMVTLDRLRLFPRRPQPHKNMISTATFNCALRTYMEQGDYAAAWTVLSCYTRYHLCPDTGTMQSVVLCLLSRMRRELLNKSTDKEVAWMDRFLGEAHPHPHPHPHPPPAPDQNKKMLADQLFLVGRSAVEELHAARHETHLKPSLAIQGPTRLVMDFLVALVRTALQAALGFARRTRHRAAADAAVKAAMRRARREMLPRGRVNRN